LASSTPSAYIGAHVGQSHGPWPLSRDWPTLATARSPTSRRSWACPWQAMVDPARASVKRLPARTWSPRHRQRRTRSPFPRTSSACPTRPLRSALAPARTPARHERQRRQGRQLAQPRPPGETSSAWPLRPPPASTPRRRRPRCSTATRWARRAAPAPRWGASRTRSAQADSSALASELASNERAQPRGARAVSAVRSASRWRRRRARSS
jgi:hypothetical protein